MRKYPYPKQDDVDYDGIGIDAVDVAREEAPAVFTYSRAEALADGMLRDAGSMAMESGFAFPVALTRAAWEKAVTVPDYALGESVEGRLWDVLNGLRAVARRTRGSVLQFDMVVSQPGHGWETVPLKAVCGSGDNGEPVITVMLPEED